MYEHTAKRFYYSDSSPELSGSDETGASELELGSLDEDEGAGLELGAVLLELDGAGTELGGFDGVLLVSEVVVPLEVLLAVLELPDEEASLDEEPDDSSDDTSLGNSELKGSTEDRKSVV